MELEVALVQTGVITADDYVAAVARQQEERPPLGQVAIEEGVLSGRRVLELLCVQSETPDLRFGELAVQLGYLRTHELAELLLQQSERERPLLEHLVEIGLLTPEKADAARRAYYASNGKPSFSDLPQNTGQQDLPSSVEYNTEPVPV